jgi:type VI secretion system protein ImpE
MTAKELFDAGRLSDAINQLNQDIKTNPRDTRNRIFLFELLCFSGDFQRAELQLETIGQLSNDAKVEIGTQVYKNLLEAEKSRARFFKNGGEPKFLSKAPAYAGLHLAAMTALRDNRPAQAEKLLAESENSRINIAGQADSQPFNNLRDCDDLLAPFLEVIVQRDYVWVPFENIKQLEIAAPAKLRDLIWIPAKVELRNDPLGEVYLPCLYSASSDHPDDRVKLGRMTDWNTLGEGCVLGAGQRMFFVDDTERPIHEVRKIDFAPV